MKWITLISEDMGKSVSLGRITFWILSLILLTFWVGEFIYLSREVITEERIELASKLFEIPEGLLATWFSSMGYNVAKKLPIMKSKEL